MDLTAQRSPRLCLDPAPQSREAGGAPPARTARRSALASLSSLAALAAAPAAAAAGAAGVFSRIATARAQTAAGPVTVEWLGWSHFRFTTPGGKVILTNPFVNNPDSPVRVEDMTRADLILVPNGHGDEVGQSVQIAQQTGARILTGGFELGTWFVEQGVPAQQVVRGNPGSRFLMDGITIRVVNSVHGSGLPQPTATTPYGGPAAGFMITFESGYTVYFAGSTAATQDQALWAQMYQPHAAILVLSGSTEPRDFAMQVNLLTTGNPNLGVILPHHHRVVQPPGQTSIVEAQAAVAAMGLPYEIAVPVVAQPFGLGQ
jgi:L-ascorbate metabolism protein UlaG (beta-lactamase superfamily)